MYRINDIGRKVLITVDEVLAKAAIDDNADLKYLRNSIEVAEERYIAPALGDLLYDELVARKNILVTTGNKAELVDLINNSRADKGKNPINDTELFPGMIVNAIELCTAEQQELWNRYLWKITAEAVDIVSIVPTWLRTTAQGQQLNSPQTLGSNDQTSASGDRKDVQYKVDAMVQDRLQPLIARMKKYLCDRTAWFPTYDTCGCSEESGIKKSVGGIITGIYDDDSKYHHRHSSQPVVVTPAARLQQCQMRLKIKAAPDTSTKYVLCNLQTVQKEYPTGMTLTIPHLIGKQIIWPIYVGNDVYADMPYDDTTGVFDNTDNGGFSDGDNVLISYLETIGG
jgi:hypothetical protein